MTIRKLTALVLALLLTAAGACAEADSLYADAERWAYFAVGEDKDADIFIIAPTVDKYDEFNMTLDDNNKFRLVRALNMQKGIYEDGFRMYAPYYAQASFKAIEQAEEEFMHYMDIGYQEVSEAFRYYLEHENQGRPIVLFGYSQGAYDVYRLLQEYFGDEALYGQLVAAYAIGWGCTFEEAEQYPQIVPAQGESDIGCVVSYEAETPALEDSIITPRGERHFAINPLNWRTDDTPADKSLNKGSVFMSNDLTATELENLCGAYIDLTRGALKVTDVDPAEYSLRPAAMPEGSFHAYDLSFFWNNLKENMLTRLEAYQAANMEVQEAA